MDRRVDRGAATRERIVATAASLFTDEGYDAVSIERVLLACGISRGALYHHFGGKEALFTAVLETVEARVADTLSVAAQGADDPVAALRAGARAWLALTRDPAVRRIVLSDAPSVVGWGAWRALEERYVLGLLKAVLGLAAAQGRLAPAQVDLYAHVLLAAMGEIALCVARSPDPEEAVRSGEAAADRLLDALLAPPDARTG